MPDDDDREAFIARYIEQRRTELARWAALSDDAQEAERIADREARWRRFADLQWDLHQQTQQPTAPVVRPLAFPPGATVPPDVGSRLEAIEDSMALLHTKLDTIIAQLAAWERGEPGD